MQDGSGKIVLVTSGKSSDGQIISLGSLKSENGYFLRTTEKNSGYLAKDTQRGTLLAEEEDVNDSMVVKDTNGRLSSVKFANEQFRHFILELVAFESKIDTH